MDSILGGPQTLSGCSEEKNAGNKNPNSLADYPIAYSVYELSSGIVHVVHKFLTNACNISLKFSYGEYDTKLISYFSQHRILVQ